MIRQKTDNKCCCCLLYVVEVDHMLNDQSPSNIYLVIITFMHVSSIYHENAWYLFNPYKEQRFMTCQGLQRVWIFCTGRDSVVDNSFSTDGIGRLQPVLSDLQTMKLAGFNEIHIDSEKNTMKAWITSCSMGSLPIGRLLCWIEGIWRRKLHFLH